MMMMIFDIVEAKDPNHVDNKTNARDRQECPACVYALWFQNPVHTLAKHIKCCKHQKKAIKESA